ncbi:hypothetical protein [Parendozoicomonas haliclonae]|uniref:Transglycosylase SLT domain-containing protein n=1 Tax=Parendozoicomonas haliclonae TaxID=1960125 RepID=A0A1X7AKE4_9GAMM|nr:hypothetical protein [Parendozoicomonas haliclonae]SMA43630.1 hypothetical protein EHSB41UT_01638 [Parendozoicomonas haliclonae]
MGICARELRHLVIRPTLKHLNLWSPTAENLLLGTAAQESGLGAHLKMDNQRALGIYQITPRMHRSVWDKFLARQPELASKVRGLASQHEFLQHPHAELATNLSYATAMAMMIYLRNGKPLPTGTGDDPARLGRCWRNHFHSSPAGTIDDFVHHYNDLVMEKVESRTN